MSKLEHWVPMELTYLGDVHALLKGGGGKLSIPTEDTGDSPFKPKGLDPH
jgi:hypothetical protein